MNRIERVRGIVDDILRGQPDLVERRWGFVHLYGVAQAAALLALRRGLDPELATVAGMLHDIATYHTTGGPDHASRSADEARQILAQAAGFATQETDLICAAIAHHSDKDILHGAFDELLKDADVWQYYLYDTTFPRREANRSRLDALLREVAAGDEQPPPEGFGGRLP